MKMVSITETRNHLSALIDRVRSAETVLIVNRGRPVARLEPVVTEPADDPDGRLARLERQGCLRRALERRPAELLARRAPRARAGASLLDALLEERRQGR